MLQTVSWKTCSWTRHNILDMTLLVLWWPIRVMLPISKITQCSLVPGPLFGSLHLDLARNLLSRMIFSVSSICLGLICCFSLLLLLLLILAKVLQLFLKRRLSFIHEDIFCFQKYLLPLRETFLLPPNRGNVGDLHKSFLFLLLIKQSAVYNSISY